MLCGLCKHREHSYAVSIGNSSYNICTDCLSAYIYGLVEQGIDAFFSAMLRNFTLDSTQSVATNFFTEEEIEAAIAKTNVYLPMFTFGILKYPYNIVAEGGVNIVENAMVRGQIMYATYGGKGFPVTKITGNDEDVVYGTYFEVPRHVVEQSYDITEGYSPENGPEYNMYNRTMVNVTLPDGTVKQANQYIANENWFVSTMQPEFQIMTGNYDDKLTHLRQILDEKGE